MSMDKNIDIAIVKYIELIKDKLTLIQATHSLLKSEKQVSKWWLHKLFKLKDIII
jgi:hypothetical protein